MQLPVAVEQARVPRRRIFNGVSSGKVRRYSAVRRASVKTFSFSSPFHEFHGLSFCGSARGAAEQYEEIGTAGFFRFAPS
jgi:hypothetical protein